MKTIPNLTLSIKFGDRPQNTESVKTLLEICLNTPPLPSQENPQGGFNYATLRARKRVSDVLDKVVGTNSEEINLEDADFETAKRAVASRSWGAYHSDLIKFAELFGL